MLFLLELQQIVYLQLNCNNGVVWAAFEARQTHQPLIHEEHLDGSAELHG
jgi:hypothetical protein